MAETSTSSSRRERLFNIRLVKIPDNRDARVQIERIGSDQGGVAAMFGKTRTLNVKIHGLRLPQAHILKQEMLSIGGDAAVAREVLTGSVERTDVLVIGTVKQLSELTRRLLRQPFSMKKLSAELKEILLSLERRDRLWKAGGREIALGGRTLIMGIVNVTPDSFSDGGLYADGDRAVERALAMIAEGADIIDVGGESTRPGARALDEESEKRRIIPVIKGIRKRNSSALVSVDTYKSGVAEAALSAGADIVNDISGLAFDGAMADTVARHGAGLVVMHTRGTPATMQLNTEYGDFMKEVLSSLDVSVRKALSAGVDRTSIVLDPGIGFSKSYEHNLFILRNLDEFSVLGYPLLVGPSRKAFIGKITGKDAPDRDDATQAAVTVAVMNGASIVRVHNVSKVFDAVRVADAVRGVRSF